MYAKWGMNALLVSKSYIPTNWKYFLLEVVHDKAVYLFFKNSNMKLWLISHWLFLRMKLFIFRKEGIRYGIITNQGSSWLYGSDRTASSKRQLWQEHMGSMWLILDHGGFLGSAYIPENWVWDGSPEPSLQRGNLIPLTKQ